MAATCLPSGDSSGSVKTGSRPKASTGGCAAALPAKNKTQHKTPHARNDTLAPVDLPCNDVACVFARTQACAAETRQYPPKPGSGAITLRMNQYGTSSTNDAAIE